MRLQIPSMALIAILSRHVRTASAFTMRPLTTVTTTVTASTSARAQVTRRVRRSRPQVSSASLASLLESKKDAHTTSSSSSSSSSSSTTSLRVASVEDVVNGNGDAVDEDAVVFPLLGKNVKDCPPRMRFAPSPTGR